MKKLKAKKLLALLLAAAMTFAMVGCGGDDAGNDTPVDNNQTDETTPTPEPTEEPATVPEEDVPAAPTEASIDFEDGAFGFAYCDTLIAGGTGPAELSVTDYNGSKALQVVPGGKFPCVALPIDQLLGDKAGDVASVDVTIGAVSADGNFYAVSGNLWSVISDGKDSQAWSVYLETANPKTVTYTVPADKAFAAGDVFAISMEVDNCKTETGSMTTLYIDNITFKDASGNVIAADTSVVAETAGNTADPNLLVLKDVVEIDGFAASGDGWAQGGIDLTEEQKALFVPGSVIEIDYNSAAPVWLVAVSSDENPNPLGTWLRGVNQETFKVNGYVGDGKVQYRYEDLVEFFGEDFGQYVVTLQCESSEKWEVFGMRVGTDSGLVTVGGTEIDGFACKGDGWAQNGIDLTDEQRALFVPGSVIEIQYNSAAPVWLVAVSSDENPNPLGTWLRGVNQETFEVDGAVGDGVVQYTYEQLVPYFGEDFGQYLNTLQCESSESWEVYSVKVGKPFVPAKNATDIEGFAASGDGWAQGGIDLTEEQKALFAPGCVITIEYNSASPVWLVAVSSDENPNPLGTWLRGVNQETFVVDGAVGDGVVQYTYDQLVPYFGGDFGQYLNTLQCESSESWEVYGMTVGMGN